MDKTPISGSAAVTLPSYRDHQIYKTSAPVIASCGASILCKKLPWRWRNVLFVQQLSGHWTETFIDDAPYRLGMTSHKQSSRRQTHINQLKGDCRHLVSINFNWIYRLSNKLVQIAKQLWVILVSLLCLLRNKLSKYKWTTHEHNKE